MDLLANHYAGRMVDPLPGDSVDSVLLDSLALDSLVQDWTPEEWEEFWGLVAHYRKEQYERSQLLKERAGDP